MGSGTSFEQGIYIQGFLTQQDTKYFKGKDGKPGMVIVQNFVSLGKTTAEVEETYFDDNPGIKTKDGEIIDFPRLPLFQPCAFRALASKAFNDKVTFTKALRLPV